MTYLCYTLYGVVMRKIILVSCFLLTDIIAFSGSVVQTPTIDFGSVGFLANSTSGFSIITQHASGTATTSGSGPLTGHSGGSSGSAGIGNFSWAERLSGTVTFQTNRNTNTTRVSTDGCGSVLISDFTTTNESTSTTASATSSSSVSFPVGAKLQLESFTGTQPCTISGTVSGPVQFRIKGLIVVQTDWTDVPINVTVHITPHLSLSHDSGAALDFGEICRSRSQQTITVNPNGTGTSPNAFCQLTHTRADSFTVTGNTGQSFSVTLPASATISNGNNSMTVSNFTSSCSVSCVLSNFTHTFKVGGTLTVPANAAIGEYTGTYSVSITY